ncbi:MAG: adenosylcobinamide-phosphate synthase CbiB [Clostridium perfringens]|nr:adenosylcobinamide-phosphate synthase CbiB [Clostridium perfringens]
MIQIILGVIGDFIVGEPENPVHPVRIIGSIARETEKVSRKIFKNHLKIAGGITWCAVILITWFISYFLIVGTYFLNSYLGVLISAVFVYFCVSAKGLKDEGFKVLEYLRDGNIEGARKRLSYIVGRDTENLDEEAILRAVIETIAENMSDGVIAPLIYIGIGGPVLGLTYKAVNTMDSMFGYKNDKYKDFGYFPAKLDDVFNFIPARITGLLIVLASRMLKLDWRESYRIYKRDKLNHSSPNSAHPEAAMAGALGIQLGGTNYYFGKKVVKPTIGDDLGRIRVSHFDTCVKVLYVTTILGTVLSLIIRLLVHLL